MCSNNTGLKYAVIWLFVSPLRFQGNFWVSSHKCCSRSLRICSGSYSPPLVAACSAIPILCYPISIPIPHSLSSFGCHSHSLPFPFPVLSLVPTAVPIPRLLSRAHCRSHSSSSLARPLPIPFLFLSPLPFSFTLFSILMVLLPWPIKMAKKGHFIGIEL